MAELFITENGVPQKGSITTWIHDDMDKYIEELDKYEELGEFMKNNQDNIYNILIKSMPEKEARSELRYLMTIFNPSISQAFLCGISAGCKIDIKPIMNFFTQCIKAGNFGVFPDTKKENFDWKKTTFAMDCIPTLNKMSLMGALAQIYSMGKAFDDKDFSQEEKAHLLQVLQDKHKAVTPILEKECMKADIADGYGRVVGVVAFGLQDGFSEDIYIRTGENLRKTIGEMTYKDGQYASTQTPRDKIITIRKILNTYLESSYPGIMEAEKALNPLQRSLFNI